MKRTAKKAIKADGTLNFRLEDDEGERQHDHDHDFDLPQSPSEAAPLLFHAIILLGAIRFLWHDSRSANVDVAGDPLLNAEYGRYELPQWLHFTCVSVVSFYCYLFVEWGTHNLGHSRKWGGDMYRIHIAHHRHYHCGALIQEGPYVSHDGHKAFMPWVMAIWVLTYLSFETDTATCSILATCALLAVSNYLHEAFHVKGHWLGRCTLTRDFFEERRQRHFLHHYKPKKNMSLGGVHSFADKCLGSYEEVPVGKVYR